MTSGFVQTVNPTVRLSGNTGSLPIELPVIEAEVTRVFGGGGSEAKITVVFDDFLTQEQISQFRSAVETEAQISEEELDELIEETIEKRTDDGSDSSIIGNLLGKRGGAFDILTKDILGGGRPSKSEATESTIEDFEANEFPIKDPDQLQAQDIGLDLTIETELPVLDKSLKRTVFAGTLTKVTEKNDRTVTFSALDARYDLNRLSVFLDVGEPTRVDTLLADVMIDAGFSEAVSVEDAGGTIGKGISIFTEQGTPKFIIDFQKEVQEVEGESWGVTSHTTMYEFVQDMMRIQGATMFIDNTNTIIFTDYPIHAQWGPQNRVGGRPGDDLPSTPADDRLNVPNSTVNVQNGLPPIVAWESASEEDQVNTVVETDFDQTGRGVYAPVSEDRLDSVVKGKDPFITVDEISRKQKENNVIARDAVRNSSEFQQVSSELQRDSGTIDVAGHPGFEPYDEVLLTRSEVDGFAPISDGNYMITEVKHIINQREGFITRLKLGEDPQELFEEIADVGANRDPDPPNRGGLLGGYFRGVPGPDGLIPNP